MNQTVFWEQVEIIISSYVQMIKDELTERWEKWPLDLAKREMHEVIGALLARQVTLATHLATSPTIWNGHIAPLILRAMTDNYINLAWIFCDPLDRSRKFILHGLGQEKLQIEHLKSKLEAEGKNDDSNDLWVGVKLREQWLDSQRYSFLTVVNVGSWSGIDTRKMAEEAGCIDLYNYAYAPFSAATHNMWHHVSKYNLRTCHNPLHRYHRIPVATLAEPDLDYVYRAAKYVNKAFRLFDEKTDIKLETSSLKVLVKALDELYEKVAREADSSDEITNSHDNVINE